MTDNRKRAIQPAQLAKLSDEQLLRLMRQNALYEELDPSLIDAVTDELNRRNPIPQEEVDAAWQNFMENFVGTEPLYMTQEEVESFDPDAESSTPILAEKSAPASPKLAPVTPLDNSNVVRPKHRPIFRVAVVAAVLVGLFLAVSITAAALDINIFEFIATWSEEHFSFTSSEPQTYATEADEEKLQQLRDYLYEYGYTSSLVPTYIPEGYNEATLEIVSDEHCNVSLYFRSKTPNSFALSLDYFLIGPDTTGGFEKDDVDPVIYQYEGTTYYIMTNMGYYLAVWQYEGLYCSISGVVNEQDLYDMINSIPME